MAEWGRIYGDPDNRDPQGALWWFERWFPVVRARPGQAIRGDGGRLPHGQVLAMRAGSAPLSLTVPRAPGVLPLRRGSPRQHEHVRRSITTAAARPSSARR